MVVSNALVGKAEGVILTEFGKPTEDLARYEPLGTESRAVPATPVRTIIYRGLNGGTLYVWLQGDWQQWTCFESCWYADGVQF
jgi:hypothetical protein